RVTESHWAVSFVPWVNLYLKTSSTLADRTGLEPATSAVTGRHSNQLNYRSSLPAALASMTKCSVFRDGKDSPDPCSCQKFLFLLDGYKPLSQRSPGKFSTVWHSFLNTNSKQPI